VLAPLIETVDGFAVATTVGVLCEVVAFDAGEVAAPLRLVVAVIPVPISVAVAVAEEFWARKVLLLDPDEVVITAVDEELDETAVDEVVGLGVSETRLPVTLNSLAQAARSRPLGQHHVWLAESEVQ
jgi:hypothetical protein